MKRITLVTPVLNDRRYLEECVASVTSQRYPNLQHIIVDGGSTDGTRELIEKHRDCFSEIIFEPDENHFDAIRKGFARADGDVLGWLNSSDILLPNALFTVNKIFSELPSVSWATGSPSNLGPSGLLYDAEPFEFRQRLYRKTDFLNGSLYSIQQESTFFSRDLYLRAGGLNIEWTCTGDFELWVRFFQHESLHLFHLPIGAFRRHADQESADKNELKDQMKQIRELYSSTNNHIMSAVWRMWLLLSKLLPHSITSRVHRYYQAPCWRYDWRSDEFKPVNRSARAYVS